MKNEGFLRYTIKVNNTFSIGEKLVLLCLFFMSIDIYSKYIYLAFLATGIFLLQSKSIKLPIILLPVLAFALSICIFSPQAKNLNSLLEPFAFLFCVLIGYNMTDRRTENKEYIAERIILVLAAGAFAHFLGNMLLNWNAADQRNTIDIWTNDIMAATRQTGLACIMLGAAVSFLFSSRTKKSKLVAIIILAVALYYNLTLATRTMLVQVILTIGITVLYGTFSERSTRKRSKVLLYTVVGFSLLLIVFNSDWFSSIFEDSLFYERFWGEHAYKEITEDSRIKLKLLYLKHMWEYPFGGFHIRNNFGVYAHDVLLDTHDEAGIFAFAAMLCILIDAVIKLVKICRNKQLSKNLRLLVLCVFSIIFMEFMIEPILEGFPWLLANFFVIYGIMGSLCKQDIRPKKCNIQ